MDEVKGRVVAACCLDETVPLFEGVKGFVYINTEMLFALFDLLGLQFAPRIRDLGEQRLYRMDRTKTYQQVDIFLDMALACVV